MYSAEGNIYYGCFNIHGLKQSKKVLAARTRKGICLIDLPGPRQKRPLSEREQGLKIWFESRLNKKTLRDDNAVSDVREALTRYLSGKTTTFHIPVDLSTGTAFQQRVWKKLKDIPYGEVRTYKWVAEGIDSPRGVRAVGQACGSNPVPIIIPCHRVIRTDGSLGGFSSGLDLKEHLLQLEGIIYPQPGRRCN